MNPDSLKHSAGTHASPISHLSEDDLNDVLLGLSTPASDLHLASCIECSEQLAEFRSTIGAFNKASLAWSEARSNSMPLEIPRRKFSFGGFGSLGSLAVSATFAFVVALALTLGIHYRSVKTLPNQASTSQAQNPRANTARQDEIASDNAMLAAINSELYRPTPSPLDEYEPKTSQRHSASSRLKD
ncbi:hypothetical protein [Granulicella sibirica]|uniref:Uncharacterized protein n=1 Tax=Granulicella sibirica TaxID=2479048 RepID=A0A4Q0SYF3_9BACT|nr:hypothetical protein [Granulicella sibirica]RXH55907.1 hypothetical protein GRAN_2764 [Granulicella sibirica]